MDFAQLYFDPVDLLDKGSSNTGRLYHYEPYQNVMEMGVPLNLLRKEPEHGRIFRFKDKTMRCA